MNFLSFLKSENGAVTVDWVVLTAALVGLGLSVMAVVSGGVEDLSGEIQAQLVSYDTNLYDDWGSGAVGGWGDLSIFSPIQSATGAESYAASVLASNGGDYQAAYNQLYTQVENMTYADGESIDDFGAFMAMAEANGQTLATGDNMSYNEMHAQYDANGVLTF